MTDFITDLCRIAANELRSAPQASTQQLAEKLKVALERNLEWQAELQSDARLIQINSGDVTAYQTLVQGGIANIGTHLHGVDQATLLEIVQEVLRSFQPVGIAQNLPSNGTSTFVGRDADMAALHEQLQQSERVAIASIHGMGGIGKTELALQYALRHLAGKVYSGGVCWLRSREEVGTQIVLFARSQLSMEPPEDLELLEQVKWCWRNWQAGEILVVFDDVQEYADVEAFLPPAGEHRFKVVMTTRQLKLAKSVQNFEIKVLDEASALNLLKSIVTDGRIDQDLETAKRLCEWLGYLPLGLELVGQYLENDADIELSSEDENCLGLWQRLQNARLDAIALKETYAGMTATDGVAAAFELSWQQLDEAEQRLAALLSLFALAEIPWVNVQACLPNFTPEELERLRNRKLLGLHLLQRTGKGMYQLHQLIREFFAAKRSRMAEDEEMKRSFCQVMVQIAEQVSQNLTLAIIEQATPAIPHLKEVAMSLHPWLSDQELILPANRIIFFYEGQSAFKEAEEWCQYCLTIATRRLGHNHLDVATSLNNLAGLYYSQGRYEEAKPIHREALDIMQRQLGSSHPDVATSLNNLGLVYRAQGHDEEAKQLYQEALEIRRQRLGADHPHVASSLNNLAELYESQGRYEEAERLYRQALNIMQQQLGNDHPNFATTLTNLAGLYRAKRGYEEAERLYWQALDIMQRQLGNDHLSVATNLNDLGLLYESQGRYEEAERLHRQALDITQRRLGNNHPSVATNLSNLALSCYSQGRYGEAEQLYRQALDIMQRQLGNNHPSVATNLNNLAGVYRAQGRGGEAERLYRQALDIMQQQLRNDHPLIAITLWSLAKLYTEEGRFAEAEPLYIDAFSTFYQSVGETDFNTRNTWRDFISFLRQIIESARTSELSDHPMTRSILQALQTERDHAATNDREPQD